MRIALIFLSALLCIGNVWAQEEAVPKHVVKAFKQQFRCAESPTWYVEPDYYEVQFLQKTQEKIAQFSKSSGELVETKILIEENQIPSPVIQAVRNKYPDYVLQEYSMLIRPETEPIYAISLRAAAGTYSLQISPLGMVLNNVKTQ